MEPIRKKLISLLINDANEEIKALDPQSQCAKELSQIEDVDAIIAEEIEKICNAATLTEIIKFFFLIQRMKKTSGQKKESIKSDIKKISEVLVTRVEAESGPSKLPQSCCHIFLDI